MIVKKILEKKGGDIFSVKSSESLCKTMDMMLEKNVAALIVMDGEKLEGIISQKDILKICHISSEGPKELKVREFMTRAELLFTCTPEDSIESLMETMTNKRIRHIPVMENNKLVGVISIGDVIKNILDATKNDNKLLKDYIQGNYPS